ncbi:MAG TPA: ribosome recycling factor [Bacillota bacterium]|nr:ribosome recycling factor [Bacillota bacterium]
MAWNEKANEAYDGFEEKMKKAIVVLENDLRTVRAGRANPHVLDPITVPYYGVPTPLQQVANIQVPEAKLLVVTPWDRSLLKDIERAIQASDLGINPVNDGQCLRLVFPSLTEERRRDLTRDVAKKGEEAKVSIRHIRREANDFYKELEKAKEISEDDCFLMGDEIQKLTAQYIEKVDEAIERKNAELMEI